MTRGERDRRAARNERRVKRAAELAAAPLVEDLREAPPLWTPKRRNVPRSSHRPTPEPRRETAIACRGKCGRYALVPRTEAPTSFLCSPPGGRGCAPLEYATNAAVKLLAETGDVDRAIALGRRQAPAAPLRRLGGVMRARRRRG